MSVPAEIGRSRYVSLVTHRRDGTPVATPVWSVPDGDELYVVSEADAWKVKRVRRDGRVEVTVCDLRGRTAPGATPFPATARLLDGPGTARARKLLARKYLTSRVGNWFARVLRIKRPEMATIAITFPLSS